MSETLSPFRFDLSLSKAYQKDGRPFVQAVVSDDRLDKDDEFMEDAALGDMLSFLKGEGKTPKGEAHTVTLLESHGGTLEMGLARDGEIVKGEDGRSSLLAEFELDPEDPRAMKLFKSVEDGTCKYQLSVGGKCQGRQFYSPEHRKLVKGIERVPFLEHVALTRHNRSAVGGAGFLTALMKSVDWEDPATTQGETMSQEIQKSLDTANATIAELTSKLEKAESGKADAEKAFADFKKEAEATQTDLQKSFSEQGTKIESLEKTAGEVVELKKTVTELSGTVEALSKTAAKMFEIMQKPVARPYAPVTHPPAARPVADTLGTLTKEQGEEDGKTAMTGLEKQVHDVHGEYQALMQKRRIGQAWTPAEAARAADIGSIRLAAKSNGISVPE